MLPTAERLRRGWFLIGLAASLAVGLWQSPRLAPVAAAAPRDAMIAAVMVLTTLSIDLTAACRGRSAWKAVALAIALSTIAAPALGGLAGRFLSPQLAAGLIIATAAPCTVASAAVWTRRAGGVEAVAVATTLLTNLGSFVVMPFWISRLAGATTGTGVPDVTGKLLLCVVAPVVATQSLRGSAAVRRWAAAAKPALGVAAQLGVITIATLGAVEAGHATRTAGVGPAAWEWGLVIASAAAVHATLLFAGWRLGRAARLPAAEAAAVAIAGSQKTLAVGVGVALEFGGLAVFPMIAYHVQQLLIDTLFADRVRGGPQPPPRPRGCPSPRCG